MLMFGYSFSSFVALMFSEREKFDYLAYFVSFFTGFQDALVVTSQNIVLGSQFTMKVTPFAAQRFLQNLVMFTLILIYSLFETKEHYRVFFVTLIFWMLISGCSLMRFDFRGKIIDE